MQLLFYTLILPILLLVYVMGVRKSLAPLRQSLVDALVIVGTCAVLAVALIPPEQTIKLGRDLRGGVSLIYAVNTAEGANKHETLTQTIKALKSRVNPQGVLDLSITAQGDGRIEVVMPLPDKAVQDSQSAYRNALDALVRAAHLTPRELEVALAENRAAELAGGDPARKAAFEELQKVHDQAKAARTKYDEGRAANLSGIALGDLAEEAAKAELAFEAARATIRTGVLGSGRLTRTLAMSTKPETTPPATSGAAPDARSARERAIADLKSEFPALTSKIDELVSLYDQYAAKRKTLDDPEDLKRLLRGAGVLDFRIAVTPDAAVGVNVQEMRQQLLAGGPNATDNPVARWFKINELTQYASRPDLLQLLLLDPTGYFLQHYGLIAGVGPDKSVYVLLFTDPERTMTHEPGRLEWAMKAVGRSTDQMGRPCVNFHLDQNGGTLMGKMTAANLNKPMAIVLDNQVYTSPGLNSQIHDSGIIQGNFSDAELDYLIRVLASGSLGARLSPEPISVSVLGPAMGKDNLYRGMYSVMISIGVTFVVMILYYFLPGIIANISLLVNALLIFFCMSLVDANFTLPGLAGVALALAMAVDSNVLIYERLREELVDKGQSLVDAIETAVKRAATAIIDGNFTHLIVVIVLYWFAGTEVKGFALVMGIGVFSTLAAGLIVTHVLLRLYALGTKARGVSMLPIAVPLISRVLRPKFDWIRYRHALWTVAVAVAVVSVVATFTRGNDIFETEFRGGTSMTMSTRKALPGEPASADGHLLLPRAEVEERLHRIGSENAGDPQLAEFRNASVLTVGEQNEKFEAATFQIKIPNPAGMGAETQLAQKAVAAVVAAFEAQMDIRKPVQFKGIGEKSAIGHARRIEHNNLRETLERSDLDQPVDQALGGVAVLIENIAPPIALDDVTERIRRLRAQPEFSDVAGRTVDVVGLKRAPDGAGYTDVAVVIGDPELLTGVKLSESAWQKSFADREWSLISSALSLPATLEQVSSISPAVAREMAFQAALAVVVSFIGMLIYIWVRFGSLLYSVATVIGVIFNVSVCLGSLALSKWFGESAIGAGLLMQDFRIDLNVVAALLIVIGYSINDTIVILDRVRENRGKLPFATRQIINDSINQTFSRTVLTGGCTALTPVVLYIMGGPTMQPFAYTFLVGLIAGTFSSVAIAAPLVYVPGKGLPEPVGGPAPGSTTTGPRTAAA